jgi:glycosyl transferase family 87
MVGRSITISDSRNRSLLSAAGSVVIVVLAAYSLLYLLREETVPIDFHVYLAAAEDIREGKSPASWSVYPPLTAIGVVPYTFLTMGVADFLAKLVLILGVGAILAVLGVRDWRCYPLALLWPPVHAAVQTGNITMLLGLAAALVWRFRDRPPVAGLSLGASVAAKFLLWPLGIWLLAVGRRAAAAWSLAAAVLIFVGSWAVVGVSDLLDYPSRLQYLEEETSSEGYSLDVLAGDLGLGAAAARALMVGVAVALLVAMVLVGRRGAEFRSYVLAIGATLAFAPLVWLHYFALLLVPVAMVRPRLAPIWFVPLGMWGFSTGTGNGTTAEAAVVLGLAAATILLAFRAAPAREVDSHRRRPARPTVRPASAPR